MSNNRPEVFLAKLKLGIFNLRQFCERIVINRFGRPKRRKRLAFVGRLGGFQILDVGTPAEHRYQLSMGRQSRQYRTGPWTSQPRVYA